MHPIPISRGRKVRGILNWILPGWTIYHYHHQPRNTEHPRTVNYPWSLHPILAEYGPESGDPMSLQQPEPSPTTNPATPSTASMTSSTITRTATTGHHCEPLPYQTRFHRQAPLQEYSIYPKPRKRLELDPQQNSTVVVQHDLQIFNLHRIALFSTANTHWS